MKQNIAIVELENAKRKLLEQNLKKEVLEQLDSIERAIHILKDEHTGQAASHDKVSNIPPATSIQGLVINAVMELINKHGRPVRNEEILEYLEEKQISLGKAKDKRAALAGILHFENNRKNGKVKQLERGVYHLK